MFELNPTLAQSTVSSGRAAERTVESSREEQRRSADTEVQAVAGRALDPGLLVSLSEDAVAAARRLDAEGLEIDTRTQQLREMIRV